MPIFVEIGSVVLEKIIKSRQYILIAFFPLKQTWIPFTEGCVLSSLVEFGLVLLEEKVWKSRQCIFIISHIFQLKKCGPSNSFENLFFYVENGVSIYTGNCLQANKCLLNEDSVFIVNVGQLIFIAFQTKKLLKTRFFFGGGGSR